MYVRTLLRRVSRSCRPNEHDVRSSRASHVQEKVKGPPVSNCPAATRGQLQPNRLVWRSSLSRRFAHTLHVTRFRWSLVISHVAILPKCVLRSFTGVRRVPCPRIVLELPQELSANDRFHVCRRRAGSRPKVVKKDFEARYREREDERERDPRRQALEPRPLTPSLDVTPRMRSQQIQNHTLG